MTRTVPPHASLPLFSGISCWAALLSSLPAAAEEIHVPDEFITIQAAIVAADDSDTVIVAPGSYTEFIDLLGKAITLRSSDGPESTFIDAEFPALEGPAVSIINGEFQSTIIDGFTIFGGNSRLGGGFRIEDSRPTIINCIIRDNHGVNGGGIRAMNAVGMHIENCIFLNNTADSLGGGLFGDSTTFPGGQPPSITMINCLFNGNSAGRGGAFTSVNAGPFPINCTFAGNSAGTVAGAISIDQGFATISNCVFGNNHDGTASQINADLFVDDLGFVFTEHSCYSLIFDMDGRAPGFGIVSLGENVFTTDPNFTDALGPDGLAGTGDEDLTLAGGSVCIDAGNNTALPVSVEFDLTGAPRFVNDPDTLDTGSGTPPIVDLGAFEFQPVETGLGDLDDDGDVDFADLLALLDQWGVCERGSACPADLDDSGDVGFGDLLLLLANWT